MKRSLTALAVLSCLSAGCAAGPDEAAPAADPILDATAADPDHYSVEFENDVMQVVRIRYGPGERSVMHSHPANCNLLLTDATFIMTPQAGEPTTNNETMGTINCGDADVHLPENIGGADAEVAFFALKGRDTFDNGMPGPPVTGYTETPDAVTADPDHYTTEFENDLLRVVRVHYELGERSVMHAHPAGCVVFLTDDTARFTLPDGTVEEGSGVQAGTVACNPASVHLPENVGDGPIEVTLVELKNREAFE
jgi:quercetin dioxygenase-like cupin family protein